MDQSISIMAPAGAPLVIHFYPKLLAEPVRFSNVIPMFVIANTLVTAEKHLTAPTNYNLRVVEVRLAAALLSKKLDLRHNIPLITLREVQEYYREKRGLVALSTVEIILLLLEEVETFIKKVRYTREEIASELGMNVLEMEAHFVGSIEIRSDGFELYKRAKHVFSEARRVYMFKNAAENIDSQNVLQVCEIY
jgi:galactokinase